MSVDMLLPRFFQEVERLYPDQDHRFKRAGAWDRRVASCPVPPYRAVFTACLLRDHAAGYRLPSFKQFTSVYGVTSRFAQNCPVRSMHEQLTFRLGSERGFCNADRQIWRRNDNSSTYLRLRKAVIFWLFPLNVRF